MRPQRALRCSKIKAMLSLCRRTSALPLARKLRDNIAVLQSDAPLHLAGADGHELSLGMVHGLAGFGLMKVAAEPTIYLKRR